MTGNKTPEEKFEQWSATVPDTLRNPLYHWTHLELQRYFGIKDILKPASGKQNLSGGIFQTQYLPEFSVRSLMAKMNVTVVCCHYDPISNLEYHLQLQQEGFWIKVLPTFRPDNLYAVENPKAYKSYLRKLEELVGFGIASFEDLLKASQQRIDFFHEVGGVCLITGWSSSMSWGRQIRLNFSS